MNSVTITVTAEQAGATLAAVLRTQVPGQSWNQVRRLIETRHVRIGDEPCLDPARRVRAGETIALSTAPAAPPRRHESIVIRHLDEHVVVAEKPTGLSTVRHPSEREWTARRKDRHPTLEDLLPPMIAQREGSKRKGVLPRLRVVHRLDKETSGLVVFARSVLAERVLGGQFRRHIVIRRYLAIVPGAVTAQKIVSRLLRDRGDGRRGSTFLPGAGKEAITHVEVAEYLKGYTVLSCRLETGRTHQIRIHLAELGHPICGEKVYNRKQAELPVADATGAPRLALHAIELGFIHPATSRDIHWEMPFPPDLAEYVAALGGGKAAEQPEEQKRSRNKP